MRRRILARFLLVGLAAGTLIGCIDSPEPVPSLPGRGTLVTFIKDAPFCDILSFRLDVAGMTLTPQGGGTGVSVLSSSSAIKLNVAALRGFSTILNLNSVPEGTYEAATFNIAVPQFILFDPTQSPPTTSLTGILSTAAPNVAIQPALTVTKDKVVGLRVDFDLLRSVQVDAAGQVTGNITPVFTITPVTASGSRGFGEMDGLVGFVRSVTPSSSIEGFTGNFLLQLLSGSGPAVAVNLTSTTQLFGVPALNQLETGRFVEVEGFVDAKGNLVAQSVEVEDREFPELNKVAFIGYVTSAAKDSMGNVTEFNLVARETEPDAGADIPPVSRVLVNVTSSTLYQFSSRATNFANLPFDATALAVGQEVVVHGTYTLTQDQPTTVAADSVYLKLQTHQGNFSSLVQVGSDDKTGAFRLAPCSSIFQGARILVLTNNQTAFTNVSGLSALTPQPPLLVKGLLFYQLQAGTVNGVAVPAGTLVLLAKQVHQFL